MFLKKKNKLIQGTCTITSIVPPLHEYGGKDGAAQMSHFTKHHLPVAWQFLVNNVYGAELNAENFAKYDALVQACLVTGGWCIVDVHNYARWDGGIIGQGGPENRHFASLWRQLAENYKGEVKVVMGLMNEPH